MKKNYTIKRMCAYCGKHIGYTSGGTAPGTISHGVCDNCYDTVMNKLEEEAKSEYSKTNKG